MGILNSFGTIFSRSDKDGSKPASKMDAPAAKSEKGAAKPPKQAPSPDKTECFHAGPADDAGLGFSITIKDGKITKRKSFRVKVKGLTVFIPRLGKTYPVTDISSSGLGFSFLKPRIKCGAKIKMDLHLHGGREAEAILCEVKRHERGVVGCAFVDLDRKQEQVIERIVLEGEKQLAARRSVARTKD